MSSQEEKREETPRFPPETLAAEQTWFDQVIRECEDAQRKTPSPSPPPSRHSARREEVADEEALDGCVKIASTRLVEVPDEDGDPAMFDMEVGDDF